MLSEFPVWFIVLFIIVKLSVCKLSCDLETLYVIRFICLLFTFHCISFVLFLIFRLLIIYIPKFTHIDQNLSNKLNTEIFCYYQNYCQVYWISTVWLHAVINYIYIIQQIFCSFVFILIKLIKLSYCCLVGSCYCEFLITIH